MSEEEKIKHVASSILYIFLNKMIGQIQNVEQKLPTLPEYLTSLNVLVGFVLLDL
jgi:hypothetical protein